MLFRSGQASLASLLQLVVGRWGRYGALTVAHAGAYFETAALLEKPDFWGKVYPNNFRPVCFDSKDKLTDRTNAFLDRLKKANIEMGDTLLWWIAMGYDSPYMIGEAMKSVGTEPEKIVGYLNQLKNFPGIYGDISFTADRHNGYPDEQVVMVEANSLKEGAFRLAPGYSS